MGEITVTEASDRPTLDAGTRLAYERTYLAHERTQMAWVRTSLSLISFGFTISKFFQTLQHEKGLPAPVLGPRAVGILMITTGLVLMVLSDIYNRRAMVRMRGQFPAPPSLAGIASILISSLGFVINM